MGLTLHWTLYAPPAADVVTRLEALRSGCLDLPFVSVTDLVHLEAAEIIRRQDQDELRWFLIQAERSIPIEPESERYMRISPEEVIGFTAQPGESEPANFFLARYPARVTVASQERPTGLTGWLGSASCKTQYASAVSSAEFLKCHLGVVAALDHAARLGLLKSVLDEGEFWERRNPEALLQTVGRWNAMMAAFVGGLELETGKTLPAPIRTHPAFERLEHEGTTADTAALVKAVAKAIKRVGEG